MEQVKKTEQTEKWEWMDKELLTVPAYFHQTCEKFPDRPALLFNAELGQYRGESKGEFTYREFQERAENIACGLMSLGFSKAEKAAIMAGSCAYWTHADMAIAAAGGVSVTIYPTLSLNETKYIINDSGSSYVFIGDNEILGRVLPGFDDMKSCKKIILFDMTYESNDERIIGLAELIKMGMEWKKENPGAYEERWKSVSIDDIFTVLYTSGTSGQGKGVLLSHWCAISRLEGVVESFSRFDMTLTEEDRTLCFLPLSHVFDRGSCVLLAICRGSSIAFADKPGTLLEDMQKYNPTWINCVPRLYEKIYITFQQQMSESGLKKKLFDWAYSVGEKAVEYRRDENGCYNMNAELDLASKLPLGLRIKYKIADKLFSKVRALFGNRFRYSFSASAQIAPELLRFFYVLGFAVIEGYGSTESFNACILNPISACKPGYMGKNANGSFARVAEDGELEISGAGLFKGYLNKPEENEASFTEDGWFKTGDLVDVSDDGYYRIVDRKKAIICTAVGKNIAPAKLENLFSVSIVIEQKFFIGDERNFISALIVPNFNYFVDYFQKNNIAYDESALVWSEATGAKICMKVGEDFVGKEELKQLIDANIQEANSQLENFEQIKKYTILTERFSEDNGLITPTQKTKKKAIIEYFSDVIDNMYQ